MNVVPDLSIPRLLPTLVRERWTREQRRSAVEGTVSFPTGAEANESWHRRERQNALVTRKELSKADTQLGQLK